MPWSDPLELVRANCAKVPSASGVYKIVQGHLYSCYRGTSDVLKFGMSEKSLRQELMNHLGPHTCANRIKRLRAEKDVAVLFSFEVLPTEEASAVESKLLRNFERRHWQSPILNSTRGFGRGEDHDWNEEA